MAIVQLLPSRVKVALASAGNDARHLVRALRDKRFKGIRARQATSAPRLEVRFKPQRSTASAAAPTVEERGVIEFADSGVTITLQPGETILEAGLRNNVDLLFSCTLGGCGACMLQVREGEVFYDDQDAICLTEDELEDGSCLACVGKPRGRVVLEA